MIVSSRAFYVFKERNKDQCKFNQPIKQSNAIYSCCNSFIRKISPNMLKDCKLTYWQLKWTIHSYKWLTLL